MVADNGNNNNNGCSSGGNNFCGSGNGSSNSGSSNNSSSNSSCLTPADLSLSVIAEVVAIFISLKLTRKELDVLASFLSSVSSLIFLNLSQSGQSISEPTDF